MRNERRLFSLRGERLSCSINQQFAKVVKFYNLVRLAMNAIMEHLKRFNLKPWSAVNCTSESECVNSRVSSSDYRALGFSTNGPFEIFRTFSRNIHNAIFRF